MALAADRSYSRRLSHTESFSSLGTDNKVDDAKATQERRRRLSAMKTQLYQRDNDDDDRSVDSQMDGSGQTMDGSLMDASLKSFTSWLQGANDKQPRSKSSNTSTTSNNSSSSNLSSQDSLSSFSGSGSHKDSKPKQGSVLGKMLSWGSGSMRFNDKCNDSVGDFSDDSSVSLEDDDIFSFPTSTKTSSGSLNNGSSAQLSFHSSGRGSNNLLDSIQARNHRSGSRLNFDGRGENESEERKLSPQVEARRKRMVEKAMNGLNNNNKEEETEEKVKELSSRPPRSRRAAKPRSSIRQETTEPEETNLLYSDKVASHTVDSTKEVQRLRAAKQAKKASRDDSRREEGATAAPTKRTPRRHRSSIRAIRSSDAHSTLKASAPGPLRRNRTVDPNVSARRLSSASIALNWNAGDQPKESSNSSRDQPKESSGSNGTASPPLQRRHTNASVRPRRQRSIAVDMEEPKEDTTHTADQSLRRTYGQSRPRRTSLEGERRSRRTGSQRPEGRSRRSSSHNKFNLPPRLPTH